MIERLGLPHTCFPGAGDESVREAHPQGHHVPEPGGPLTDVTELDPSWAWAAGQSVSTPATRTASSPR
ncbi:hypothetical protein GCM10010345_85660 [Streptomyces canarius]|uniref:Uncharacterized protein n=1 Tax=Streptomyces canarius TaxID=285453 RepID=A0ABQ3DAY1_9ACTN|nr:hypothetical protein GCM10010345_85660 [Streptomyces canarius]